MATNNAWNSDNPAKVPSGGTGLATTTAYGVICGGTTATGNFQNATAGTSGQLLTSNGASALPTWQALQVNIQTFTSSGTYTPTSGMKYCIVECLGGGGGGGGSSSTTSTQLSCGAGGGSGEYRRGHFSASTIGGSQTVTINSGGGGGSAGNNAGSNGGDVLFGALITAKGGGGGQGSGSGSLAINQGGSGGSGGSGGDFAMTGNAGGTSFAIFVAASVDFVVSGAGAPSLFGGGPIPSKQNNAGGNGNAKGAGGSGGSSDISNGTGEAGGNGVNGIVIVTEFVIA